MSNEATERMAAGNSTYKKLAVQCSAEIPIAIGMVNQTLVLRINSDSYRNGENRQLLVAANLKLSKNLKSLAKNFFSNHNETYFLQKTR